MSKEQQLKNARQFREAIWSATSASVVDEIVASDCVLHGRAPFSTGFQSGPMAIRQLIDFYQLTFSDIQVSVEHTVVENDFVTVHWMAKARHTGDLLGVPPTDRLVETNGIDLLRFNDEKIQEVWAMWDAIGFLFQLAPGDRADDPEGPDLLGLAERLLK